MLCWIYYNLLSNYYINYTRFLELVQKTCSAPTQPGCHCNILNRHSGRGSTNKLKTIVDRNKPETCGHTIHKITKYNNKGDNHHMYRYTHHKNHNHRSTYIDNTTQLTCLARMHNYYHIATYVWNRRLILRSNNNTYSTSKTF